MSNEIGNEYTKIEKIVTARQEKEKHYEEDLKKYNERREAHYKNQEGKPWDHQEVFMESPPAQILNKDEIECLNYGNCDVMALPLLKGFKVDPSRIKHPELNEFLEKCKAPKPTGKPITITCLGSFPIDPECKVCPVLEICSKMEKGD